MWFGTCSNLCFKVVFLNKNLVWDKKRIVSSINWCQVLQYFSYAWTQTSKRGSPLVTEVTFYSTRGQTEKGLAKVRALRPSLLSSRSSLKCWHAGTEPRHSAFKIPCTAAPCKLGKSLSQAWSVPTPTAVVTTTNSSNYSILEWKLDRKCDKTEKYISLSLKLPFHVAEKSQILEGPTESFFHFLA